MSIASILAALAPEWILLFGACLTIALGITGQTTKGAFAAPCALITLILALVAAATAGIPAAGEVVPGLWLSPLTAYIRWITLAVGILIVLVNWRLPAETERGEYMGLILFSLLGLLLTAAANDLIVLFFAIELVSIPTYILIALSRTDARASEASVKYFFLGALSAATIALGIAYLYGASGSTAIYTFTNGTAQSILAPVGFSHPHALIGFLLLFAGLAFKIAAFPFHAYVADVYEGAAAPISGMLGFVPKLAGIITLAKVLAAFDWSLSPAVFWTIWIVAAATMTTGNVLALLQRNVKRMLAYSSIAHTGYMLVALLVGPMVGLSPLNNGVSAALFYIAVYGAMNLGAFTLIAAFRRPTKPGISERYPPGATREDGSESNDREVETLDDLGGISRKAPAAALAFAICLFSLMGIPPTAGFLGKVYIFGSALSLDAMHPMRDAMVILVIIGVLNAAIGAAYYLRIVSAAYMGADSTDAAPAGGTPARLGLALCSIPLILLFARPALLNSPAEHATIALRQSVPYETLTSGSAPDPSRARKEAVASPSHGRSEPQRNQAADPRLLREQEQVSRIVPRGPTATPSSPDDFHVPQP